jgi:hypothetical protein
VHKASFVTPFCAEDAVANRSSAAVQGGGNLHDFGYQHCDPPKILQERSKGLCQVEEIFHQFLCYQSFGCQSLYQRPKPEHDLDPKIAENLQTSDVNAA